MILQYLQYAACIITIIAGVYALVSPQNAISMTGLLTKGGRGVTEIRCAMGALYLAIGVSPFLLGHVAFQVLGIAYLSIAVVRLVSMFVDKSSTSSNWASFAMELACGIVLVL
jgi:hypothetical protein